MGDVYYPEKTYFNKCAINSNNYLKKVTSHFYLLSKFIYYIHWKKKFIIML